MRPRPPILTVANALTLVRLPLAGLLWLAPSSSTWMLSVLAIAAVTDVVDGRFARWIRSRQSEAGGEEARREASAAGAWLDPICDKIFAISLLAAAAVGAAAPLWLVAATLTREILLVPLYAFYRAWPWLRQRIRYDFRAGRVGKLTTVWQFATVVALLFAPRLAPIAAGCALVFGGAAAALYARRGLGMLRDSIYNPLAASVEARQETSSATRRSAAE